MPVTVGVWAPVRSVGSSRQWVDSTDLRGGARPRTLSELLQARVPGVSVLRHGGDPSDGSRVRVRGTTSLVGDAAPVVIVDGIPVSTPEVLGSTLSRNPSSRFDDFDPEEIERIDVLAGPAATTLFGSGASNGAIVITTNRGASGPPRWRTWSRGDLSGETTAYPANYRRNGTSPSTGAAADRCDVVAIATRECNPTTLDVWNPLEAVSPFSMGQSGAGGASIAGGPLGIRAYASALGRMESAVLNDSRASRLNARVNAERELFGQLTIAGNVGYVRRHATTRGDNIVLRGLFGAAADDANRGYLEGVVEDPITDRDGDRLSRSIRADWRALPWLRVHGAAGRDEITQRDFTLTPKYPQGTVPFTTRNWQASSLVHATAEASHRAGVAIGLRTLLSYEESDRRAVEEQFTGDGGFGSFSSQGRSIRSWMVQERVAFRDRLFLNVGARRIDGERSNNRARWHPSVDFAWDFGRVYGDATLRLRGAYAVGVQPRDTTSPFAFFVPISPFGPPPAPIEPEEPREGEIGFDATIGKRVDLRATLFAQQTPKLIVNTIAPQPSAGLFAASLGKMSNRGLELAARVRLIDRPTTQWRATVTLATLRNRVSGLQGPPSIFNGPGIRDEQPFGVYLRPEVTFIDANGDNLPSPSEITITGYRPAGGAMPTREAALRSELGLAQWGLVLGAALDHRGGHHATNVFDAYQCLADNCRELQDPSASLAEQVNAVVGTYLGNRSAYLESASYTRLAEVTLEWTPPSRFGRAISNGVRVSLEGRNLVTWTAFGGPDPEVATATAFGRPAQLPILPALPRTLGVRVDLVVR